MHNLNLALSPSIPLPHFPLLNQAQAGHYAVPLHVEVTNSVLTTYLIRLTTFFSHATFLQNSVLFLPDSLKIDSKAFSKCLLSPKFNVRILPPFQIYHLILIFIHFQTNSITFFYKASYYHFQILFRFTT